MVGEGSPIPWNNLRLAQANGLPVRANQVVPVQVARHDLRPASAAGAEVSTEGGLEVHLPLKLELALHKRERC